MRVGSLFAGVGGFDLAAERVGMTVAWQSENDPYASRVLNHHWPDANLGDARAVKAPAAVDVLAGGFPCQDYSQAGRRGGLAGDRGGLWWEMTRLVDALRPAWVVGENVPGLISSRGGADFATILDSLTERGYGVAWCVLDAQHFGVAQQRRRVFIVAHSGGRPRPDALALGEGLYGHPPPRREPRRFGGGPVPVGVKVDHEVSQAVTTKTGGLSQRPHHDTLVVSARRAETATQRRPTRGQQAYRAAAATLTQGGPTAGRRREDDVNLVAGGDGDGAARVRRLTPLECERLQGFPDGWTAVGEMSDTQRYRQLGNAVAVPVAHWVLAQVGGSIEASPRRGGGGEAGGGEHDAAQPGLFSLDDRRAEAAAAGRAAGWLASAAASDGGAADLWALSAPAGLWERAALASSHQEAALALRRAASRLPNAGMAWPGRHLALKTSEWRNNGTAASLSDILEDEPGPQYWLSAKAAAGVLRRAESRGATLPAALVAALRSIPAPPAS